MTKEEIKTLDEIESRLHKTFPEYFTKDIVFLINIIKDLQEEKKLANTKQCDCTDSPEQFVKKIISDVDRSVEINEATK